MSANGNTECEVVAVSGSSPTKNEAEKEESPYKKVEALECLVNGKRHLLCKDIPAATSSLAEACELLAAECGEKAPECGEAYYFYGKALLEMARLENLVLGNALEGVPESEDVDTSPQVEDPEKVTDEERADIEGKVDEALEENLDTCEKAECPLLTDDVAEATAKESPVTVEGVIEDKNEEIEGGDSQEDTEDECEHADNTEAAAVHEAKAKEEPSNLQLAWEVLELSKIICKEQLEFAKKDLATSDTVAALEKRACNTYLVLAEISVESGNFGQAVEDLKVCLERQKALLPIDSRIIAETHYRLGVALGFSKMYEEALLCLDAAISVLNERMVSLSGQTGSESIIEVAEIELLVPEIEAKIADLNDLKKASMEPVVDEIKGTAVGSKTANAIPVKRKSDEGLPMDAKKIKG